MIDMTKARKRHIDSFVHMIIEGDHSYTSAWEIIKSRTIIAGDELTKLSYECIDAHIAARNLNTSTK